MNINRLSLLSLAIGLSLTHTAFAQSTSDENKKILDKVTVTADPLGNDVEGIVQPANVLAGAELDAKKSNTLGETVSSIAGVTTSFFGPGVGRPVIRGQDGARVAILSNGMASDDVSNVSQDHAVSIEPFLADQIEVIKGPTNLLYGSGAIAGIVNASDGRIVTSPIEIGLSGRAETRYDNGSSGYTQMIRTDWGSENFALHADGVYRDNEDSPGPNGDIANSAVQTRTGAIGGSVFSDWGYAGASLSRYLNEYGNPAEPGDNVDPGVTLNMQQTRFDSKLGFNNPIDALDVVKLAYSYTDYQHTEFEGDEIGTQFFSKGHQLRAEAVHSSNERHKGAFGIQAQKKEFEAIGAEAFIPSTKSSGYGVFIVEQFTRDKFKTELGARFDNNKTEATGFNQRNFSLLSLSAASRFAVNKSIDVTLNLDHAERSPVEEELFSDGLHAATAAYEIGNPNFSKEKANQIELGVHYHGDRFEAKASVYHNKFDDFIYLSDTGLFFDDDGDLLPIRQWAQADAKFKGYEVELVAKLGNQDYRNDLRLFIDGVEAKLANGEYLPRIPSSRIGAEWTWEKLNWSGGLLFIHSNAQNDIASYETPTDSYSLLNANLNYQFHNTDNSTWEAFIQGNNLTNQEAYAATSAIKDLVPLPGRNISAGIRVFF
jgi:iron complex outermembrane receptor protein